MSIQIIKTRDDIKPIYFKLLENHEVLIEKGEDFLELSNDSTCSWLKKNQGCNLEKSKQRIEPWLTSLFKSEHFSILIGSGLSHSIHQMATGDILPGMNRMNFSVYNEELKGVIQKSSESAERSTSNIEDDIRVVNELLIGLYHYCNLKNNSEECKTLNEEIEKLNNDLKDGISQFANSILLGENKVATAEETKRSNAFNYLINFLMSFAGRSGTHDRLHIFTTNYDRFIEAGAELAGLHLIDRFIGNLCPIFRSSRLDIDMHYSPPGIRGEPRYLEGVARFSKLHGSLDWVNSSKEIRRMNIPFGSDSILPYLNAPGLYGLSPMEVLIYPNSAKDRETAFYPYIELFRDFAAAICRPNSVLVTYGYSFGDEHINRIIEDMLTIPSTHLVIISYSDPLDRIMNMYKKLGKPTQITLSIGSHFGNLQSLVDYYLPKSAIDKTTFRMADLLKVRYGIEKTEPGDTSIRVEGVTNESNPI